MQINQLLANKTLKDQDEAALPTHGCLEGVPKISTYLQGFVAGMEYPKVIYHGAQATKVN